MNQRKWISAGLLALVGTVGVAVLLLSRMPASAEAAREAALELKLAASRISHVTVYQNNALVTREVDVPEGVGTLELVVSPLPAETVNTSLYSEGTEGLRVLTTRFRLRPVKEDTRQEVRKLETQLKELQQAGQKIQAEIATYQQDQQMITKLENFTAASATAATEKGKLDGDQIITLSDYVMKQRQQRSKELVTLQQQLTANQEQIEFVSRQMRELTSGTSKVERDAIIIVDKTNRAASKLKLNYLVSATSWRPQYRFRANGKDDKEVVQIEYLAGVIQQTGEDWSNVQMTLSTAEPMLNAAPPELRALSVSLVPRGTDPSALGIPGIQPGGAPGTSGPAVQNALDRQSQMLRSQAAGEYNQKKAEVGGRLINDAAALEQSRDFLWRDREEILAQRENKSKSPSPREGQSVTYHLTSKLTVPSRNEEQVIEVTRLDLKPDFAYKAVPVLTRHVYRLANLVNSSETVLLPGEANMYNGNDFVGRMDLPLVAIGETFTAGFGVDPQLQVEREMLDKQRSQQGGNQVLTYDYRILVSSYKSKPVKVQVWDRLPRSEQETVNVAVMKATPDISADPLYMRQSKTQNVLRWDLDVEPGMRGDKAREIKYSFRVELDRQMQIGGFLSK